ncbi:quinone-dependent dihydroorotate dehydrogenase [Stenotrophomonas sp. 24(2023)]|uniref:quinone-dependent dihydroorotate dehydrogenase n=1 Tax=Stenotrophomonas sp. 24(2023) TaxID=3068324 RepID=UPI0027DFEAC8|nr:quinone-dependent dihydroorotate dehydrogenase [Stenotrophomonas sp. 24(2023)]WMJ68969.1 quinone-dependent dihydroorotate dehydrogenase [Stenotrophomonas sp. 24(2023)]
MYSLARPFLFSLDAERAHGLGLSALDMAYRTGTTPLLAARIAPLPTDAFGLTFPNPVGLAAGLDKNGAHIDALFALGFGFVEIGTITPRPQAGNPRPRLFRLPTHGAIINRMGFNNDGVDALVRNVERARNRRGLLGINIGKNKDTPNEQALQDYLLCLDKVYPLADYITVNISSPNTAGLRELQEETALRQLVAGLRERQEALAAQHGRRVPMLVKVAPDLNDRDIDAAARVLGELQVDGVIATNTTIDRSLVAGDPLANEAGGLSGAPLLAQSTLVLRRLRARLPETMPLIGVGGIQSGADAVAKMAAGAALVQCYSGLIYKGPALVGDCVEAIRRRREAPSRGAVAPL